MHESQIYEEGQLPKYHSLQGVPEAGKAGEVHISLPRHTSEQQTTCTAASLGWLYQNGETYPHQHKQTPPILALFETGALCLD